MRASQAVQYIEAHLRGALATEFDAYEIIAQAATTLETLANWSYLIRTQNRLSFRASVAGTAATYTASNKTVTLAGAFTGYTLIPGDSITLDDAGATLGTFHIVSKTDANTLVIDSAALTSDISGTVGFSLNTARVALPSDFGRTVSIHRNRPGGGGVVMATPQELQEFDSANSSGSVYSIACAVEYASLTATEIPTPTLRIWPHPTTEELDALTLIYARKWPEINSDEDVLPIPAYMNALFLEALRAFASAYDNSAMLGPAVDAIRDGRLFLAACRADSGSQSYVGTIMNGAIRPRSWGGDSDSEFVLNHIVS